MYYTSYHSQYKIQNDWVNQNFSSEDIGQYYWALNENFKLWAHYKDQGWLREETVYESIFVPELNDTLDLGVGVKVTVQPGVNPSQLQLHPEYASFLIRIPQEFQPIIPISID